MKKKINLSIKNIIKNKILIFLTLFSIIIFFSGCSNQSLQSNKIDNTGKGLEVELNLKTDEILYQKINYDMILKNSGKEKLNLQKENIKLNSIEKLKNGKDVFTEESLNNFYSKLFNPQLKLFQNQEKKVLDQILKIDSQYFNNINNEEINLVLNINYPYITEFTNNVEINVKDKNKLKILDELSQAAPLKIDKIDLKQGEFDNEFIIIFELKENSNFISKDNSIIKINEYKFNFKGNELDTCIYFTKNENLDKQIQIENLILNKKNTLLKIKCKTTINEKDITITKVSGEIKYDYSSKITKNIKLPKIIIEIKYLKINF